MNFIVSKKKHRPYSPTPEVLAMGQIQITGNITPPIWFDRLRTSSGKPNAVAVTILSEIAECGGCESLHRASALLADGAELGQPRS